MLANRHPADRLAEVRAAIRELQTEEQELRQALLAEDADLSGDEHYARLVTVETTRLDRKLLEDRFGKKAVAECAKPVVNRQVRIIARFGDSVDDE